MRISIRNRQRAAMLASLLLSSLLISPLAVSASQGDRSSEYKSCVASCTQDVCGPIRHEYMAVDGDGTVTPSRLPLMLRLTFWSCPDDCSYHCMHRITNEAQQRVKTVQTSAKEQIWNEVKETATKGGRPSSQREINDRISQLVKTTLDGLRPIQKEMVQYHGKWVFIRVFGAQEPLSVIFSLMNLAVHLKYLPVLRNKVPDIFPLKLVYLAHSLISANAWAWSSMFHARDKSFTERMDYFSAGAAILSGFFFTIARLFRLAPGDPRFTIFLRGCGIALVLHILYLSFTPRFDYSYNMTINVLLALGHNILWLAYSLFPKLFPDGSTDPYRVTRSALRAHKPASGFSTPNGSSPPPPILSKPMLPSTSRKSRRRLRLIVLALTSAAALELLDFAPLMRALDAHALWHLSTVPIAAMWYEWILEDACECVSSGFWIGDALMAHERAVTEPVMRFLSAAGQWTRQNASGPLAAAAAVSRRGRRGGSSTDDDGSIDVNGGERSRRGQGSNLELKVLTERLSSLAGKAGLMNRSNASSRGSAATPTTSLFASLRGSSNTGVTGGTAANGHGQYSRSRLSDEVVEGGLGDDSVTIPVISVAEDGGGEDGEK